MFQFDVRKFDIYRKVPKDLTQPTRTGAVISICSISFIIYLLVAELLAFLTPEIVSEVYVDDPGKALETIPVHLRISLFKINCRFIGLDIQDNMGRHDVGYVYNSKKTELAEGGCLLDTIFAINKVNGNFHVSTHSVEEQPEVMDFSHEIHQLSFGYRHTTSHIDSLLDFKTSFRPLDDRKVNNESAPLVTHDYYLRIVPTVLEEKGQRTYPYQFTSLYASRVAMIGNQQILTPAIWFRYELAPVTVEYKEKYTPFYHFLTQICAIIGGTFTVAGIIDSAVFSAHEIVKKIELGKQG